VMKSMRETASVVALGSATAPEEHDAVKAALGPSTEWGSGRHSRFGAGIGFEELADAGAEFTVECASASTSLHQS
jgi:hypothetical protein